MQLFHKLYKLTSWLFPVKYQRQRYKDFCTFLDSKKELKMTHENYNKVLERLKKKTDRIKVVFLIRENQKWTYQTLYEKFEKSDKFEPLILISILELARKGKDKTRDNLEENYNFFKSRGMKVDYAYKNGEYTDLKEFSPDIVFYDQPWDLPYIHSPQQVSEFALTFYSSYSYELVDCPDDYTSSFHRFLYKFFVEHELNIKRYESYIKGNGENCVAVGYPKLDEFFNETKDCNIWKDQDKTKIIYAPHHSLENNGLRLATFKQNGKFILELAKKHPETTWVFKPHPRLKYALIRTKTMTTDEADEYFNEWAKVGTIYEEGNYTDLLRTSDMMITDGCSFLAEYLPTEKPLIRLINKKSVKLNELGQYLVKGYYSSYNNEELEKIFNELLTNKDDLKKGTRLNLINDIVDRNELSSEKIYKIITKIMEI